MDENNIITLYSRVLSIKKYKAKNSSTFFKDMKIGDKFVIALDLRNAHGMQPAIELINLQTNKRVLSSVTIVSSMLERMELEEICEYDGKNDIGINNIDM